VSAVELSEGRGGDGHGAESYDRKKSLTSVIHSIISECSTVQYIYEASLEGTGPGECIANYTEAEFLDEIQTKVLRVFLLDIRSHLYSFTLKSLFLQTHAISYSFYSSVTIHWKGERRKT
jgi:hypothetical protein